MNLLVIGEVHSGKTTWCSKLVEQARADGVRVGGILCPAAYEDGHKIGYDMVNVQSGEKKLHARYLPPANFSGHSVGRFLVANQSIEFGKAAILQGLENGCRLIIIDEAGQLEVDGLGVMPAALEAYKQPGKTVTVVRSRLIQPFLCYLQRCGVNFQFETKVIKKGEVETLSPILLEGGLNWQALINLN